MKSYTVEEIKSRVIQLGFMWMDNHGIGIRSKEDKPNEFDDKFYYYISKGQMIEHTGTTNPGTSWLLKFMNPKGTAVLAANRQYIDGWKLGLHKGYEAMVQNKPVWVYRDNDKDNKSEELGTPECGWYGINHHRANANTASKIIDAWSAGCQVRNDPKQFQEFLTKFKESGKKFYSYSILTEW